MNVGSTARSALRALRPSTPTGFAATLTAIDDDPVLFCACAGTLPGVTPAR